MKYLLLLIFIFSCGGIKETKVVEVPRENQDDNRDDDNRDGDRPDLFLSFVDPTAQRHCSICHPGTAYTSGNKADFLDSAACRRVADRTMPPRNSPRFSEWTDELRDKIIDFCNDSS